MSDSNDEKKGGQAADGMVRKTRRVRKRRRSEKKSPSQAKDDAKTLFGKAKELLIGMHSEDEDYGPIDVAEQVRRLKRKKEDDRPLDDVWGTKKRSSSWLWIVLAGAIVSVVAIVVGVTIWAQQEPKAGPDQVDFDDDTFKVRELDLSSGPLGWFDENSTKVLAEVKSIIETVNEAEEAKAVEKLVRDSPFRVLNPIRLEDRGAKMLTNSLSNFSWSPMVVESPEQSGSKARGYLEISGLRADNSPYKAFFVLQDGRVRLDWDATMGWSEMPVEKIATEKPRKSMLLRCRVTKKSSFDQKFGDTNYSGYVLAGEKSDEFFFAYVDLDTGKGRVINRGLRLLLNYGSFISTDPPMENVKVTLRVVFRPNVGEDGVFEIVEYLHDGWVSP